MPKPLKVLIIEDEPDFYSDCLFGWDKSFINTSGFQSLEDVQIQFKEQFSSWKPDLVILDLVLILGQQSDESIQVLRYILNSVESTPVLIVTKKYNPFTRSRVLDLGCIDLIDKNDLLNNKTELDNICGFIARQYTKYSWPFRYLENCKIGITDDNFNTGERIIGDQKYHFYTRKSFQIMVGALLMDTRICPAYFFPNLRQLRFSNDGVDRLIQLAEAEEKLNFTDLKNILRERIKYHYKQDRDRILEISITEISNTHSEKREANPKEFQFLKLEEMVKHCIFSGKPPQDVSGLKEQFLDIYSNSPDILSGFHRFFFRAFIKKSVTGTNGIKTNYWYENHFLKSLFLASLPAIVSGLLAWIFALQVSYIFSLSAVVFGITAFILIKNDPKNKYFRTGVWIIGIIGIINFLPNLDTAFEISKDKSNTPWRFFFKLGIQDTWYVSILLLILSILLFVIQYRVDTTSNSSK